MPAFSLYAVKTYDYLHIDWGSKISSVDLLPHSLSDLAHFLVCIKLFFLFLVFISVNM